MKIVSNIKPQGNHNWTCGSSGTSPIVSNIKPKGNHNKKFALPLTE